MSNITKLQCPKCERIWDYTGEKSGNERVTCPSCWYKFPMNRGTLN